MHQHLFLQYHLQLLLLYIPLGYLKLYLKETEGIIDLTFHKFTYKKQEYTQLEIVNRLIEITDYLSKQDEYYLNMDKQKERLVKEMYDLLKLVHFYLWW